MPTNAYAARAMVARAANSSRPLDEAAVSASPLTLPRLLAVVPPAPTAYNYALPSLDDHGRVRIADLAEALAWDDATHLAATVAPGGGSAVLRPTATGDALLDRGGRLRLPLAVRQALALRVGNRVLLAAADGRLSIVPTSALATLVGGPDA